MREILSINIGKTGVESGISSQELYNGELGLPPTGLLDPNTNTLTTSEISQIPVFYSEVLPTSSGEQPKYIPRSIFADMDESTINNLRVSQWRHSFHKNQFLSGVEDAGGNFAKGYLTAGKEFFDLLEDRVRKMTEACDDLEGFMIHCGMGGGTGSGLTQRLLEHLSTKYPKRIKLVVGVYPTPQLSKMIVEPYNVVLGTHALLENADVVIVFDNEAIYDLNRRSLGVSLPRYIDIDRVIAYAMRGITAPIRYSTGGLLDHTLTDIKSNLIPFPRIQFLTPGCAPMSSSHIHLPSVMGEGSPESSWLDAFKSANMLTKCNSSYSYADTQNGKYLAVTVVAQGENIQEENVRSSMEHLDYSKYITFPTWVESKRIKHRMINHSVYVSPTSGILPPNISYTQLSNTTGIQMMFSRFGHKFDLMYAKRAYVHTYVGEGMEEGEFANAREDYESLLKDYQEIEAEVGIEGEAKESKKGVAEETKG